MAEDRLSVSPIPNQAKVLIERWRVHYNTAKPHSSPGYRPPAPRRSPRLIWLERSGSQINRVRSTSAYTQEVPSTVVQESGRIKVTRSGRGSCRTVCSSRRTHDHNESLRFVRREVADPGHGKERDRSLLDRMRTRAGRRVGRGCTHRQASPTRTWQRRPPQSGTQST